MTPFTTLRIELSDRPYLGDILERYTKKYDLSFAHIVEIVIDAPAQGQPLGQSEPFKGNGLAAGDAAAAYGTSRRLEVGISEVEWVNQQESGCCCYRLATGYC
jgi:hypothetical protein